jgi:hypothetical protein
LEEHFFTKRKDDPIFLDTYHFERASFLAPLAPSHTPRNEEK